MKVLLLTSKPAYPIIDGGCYATARFIDCLINAEIDFNIFTLSTEKHSFNLKSFPTKITSCAEVLNSTINTRVTLLGGLKSLFSSDSYNVNRFYDETTNNRLKALILDGYTHVVFDSLYTTPYLDTARATDNVKAYIRTHNVEHQIWQDNSKTESNLLKRAFSKNLSHKLKAYEINALNNCDGVFSISENDTKNFKQIGVKSRIFDIPVTIEVGDVRTTFKSNSAFHIGSMNWLPNVKAVEELIKTWPEVRKMVSQAELHIAGSGMQNWTPPTREGVVIEGFVQNMTEFAQNNGILVSPITSGSGVKIKILEMLALGIPIITTDKGAEGLKETKMLLLVNEKNQLARSISKLFNSPDLMLKMSKDGQQYIRKHHNIDSVSQQIKAILSE